MVGSYKKNKNIKKGKTNPFTIVNRCYSYTNSYLMQRSANELWTTFYEFSKDGKLKKKNRKIIKSLKISVYRNIKDGNKQFHVMICFTQT